ncbi:MAG: DUF3552 domain-containing protein, partial [Dehalococcoidia bacterium]|nr:DUF3552 domain-containing protein [Dehalococcoidia bacterium]
MQGGLAFPRTHPMESNGIRFPQNSFCSSTASRSRSRPYKAHRQLDSVHLRTYHESTLPSSARWRYWYGGERMDAPIVVLLAVLSGLFGVGLGALGFFFVWNNVSGNRMETAKNEASKVVEDARSEERRVIREAREEAKRTVSSGESKIKEAEGELRERRREMQGAERRISNREENLDKRAGNLERRERELTAKEEQAAEIENDLQDLKLKQTQRLEEISSLSMEDAQSELMRQAEEEIQHELALQYRDMEDEAR